MTEYYTWQDPVSGELFTTSEPFGEGLCLYEFVLRETHGEREESYDMLCWARNMDEADRIADDYARQFFSVKGPSWEDEGTYYFFGGELAIEVRVVRPTNYPEWAERQFQKAMVNRIYKPKDTQPEEEEADAH